MALRGPTDRPRNYDSAFCKSRAVLPAPDNVLKKFFGDKSFEGQTPEARKKAELFLAKQLKVRPDQVKVAEDGRLLVSSGVGAKIKNIDLDDDSFLIGNGPLASMYEAAEMTVNDVMSGTASCLGPSVKARMQQVAQGVGKVIPEPIKKLAKSAVDNGALVGLTAAGAIGALGVGIWMAQLGGREVAQGMARGDRNQIFSGGRHLFLGAEATAASAALATKLSSHAFFQAAGNVAKTLAAPFAVVHGVVDVAQGTNRVAKSLKKKDALLAGEGLAEIGMGIGWLAAGFGATPAVVGLSVLCLGAKVGASMLRNRRDRKAAETEISKEEKIHQEKHVQTHDFGIRENELVDAPILSDNSELFSMDNPDKEGDKFYLKFTDQELFIAENNKSA